MVRNKNNKRTDPITWFPDLFQNVCRRGNKIKRHNGIRCRLAKSVACLILAAAVTTLQTAGVIRRESPGTLLRTRDSELMNCFCCPVHLIKMKKSSAVLTISILVLLSLASQVSWCAASAEESAGVSTEWHRLRPHLQVQEQLHGDMKDHLQIRKLGPEHDVVSTVELKHHRRITTGHKGGSAGGGAGAGGAAGAGAGAGTGGRNVGGGGAVTRPHGSKNGAAAIPVPVAFVLVLALGCGVALSALTS